MNRFLRRVKGAGRERGAVAVIIALVMVILLTAAAIGADIAKLAYERQALRAAVDAAAQAGSYALPDAAAAVRDAKDFALASAPDLHLNRGGASPYVGAGDGPENQVNVKLYCAVAVKSGTTLPDESQVPGVCDPGSAWVRGQLATGCNTEMCLLPCAVDGSCNTIKVSYAKTVDFMFGPAINMPTGSTGAVSSAACHGICGAIAPNPMNVVVMADRTFSMSNGAVSDLKTGLKSMLTTMTRQHQFVAFGAIHKSQTEGSCLTGVASNTTNMYTDDSYVRDQWGNKTSQVKPLAKFKGSWVPVGYSSNYTTGAPATNNLALNNSSSIVTNITCLQHEDNQIGTQLASALKGAARYLQDNSNVTANVPAQVIADRALLDKPIRKVIIFETDGRPDEVLTSDASALTLGNDYDIGASGNGNKGCTNLQNIASQIKALPDDILIITIGYGDVTSMTCAKSSSGGNTGSGPYADDVLASVASPVNGTTPSRADNSNCADENQDNDYYFCAANGSELSSIFLTAFGKISGNTKLIKVDGVSN
jgi:hypothetical protein